MKTTNFFLLTMVFLFFSSTLMAQLIEDDDKDTQVNTELTADDDQIRFRLGGTYVFKMKNRTLEVLNTGNSIFIGEDAGLVDDLTGNANVFIGTESGLNNTNGQYNVGLGFRSLRTNVLGRNNMALGRNSMYNNVDGGFNVAIGAQSLFQQTDGDDNVGIGNGAGLQNQAGSQNVFIGSKAGRGVNLHDKSGSVHIGYEAGSQEEGSNTLYIDNSNTTTPLIYGDFSLNRMDINGDLDVKGTIDVEGANEFLDFHATSTSWHGMRFYDGTTFDGAMFYRTGDDGVNLSSGTGTNGLRYNFATNNASLGTSFADQRGKFHIFNNSGIDDPELNLQDDGGGYSRLEFSNTAGDGYWHVAGRANGTNPLLNFWYDADGSAGATSGVDIMSIDGDGQHVGILNTAPLYPLHVKGDPASSAGGVIYAEATNTNNADYSAVRGVANQNSGFGYGVYGEGGYMGVRGRVATDYTGAGYGGYFTASATTSGTRYAVYGSASGGSTGTRYGIYGSASGGTTNWAGYFASGNVYVSNDLRIGNTAGATGYKVAVDGKIICEELKVEDSGSWPDYVFEKDYELKSLEEVEASINKNGHLPGIPSAAQITEDGGYHVGDMQRRTIEKVEELTLYLIESNKQMKVLQAQNEALLKRIEELENK